MTELFPDPEVVAAFEGLDHESFVEHLASLDDPEDELEAIRARFFRDWRWMAAYCWPDRFTLPFNRCHDALVEPELVPYPDRPTDRDAVAAPRGTGKSSLASFVDPHRRIVYGVDAFIVIESAVQDLAIELVSDLYDAFLATEGTFLEVYGPFTVEGGKSDFTVSVRGAPSVRVLAKSWGQSIRGVKHRGVRPTCIIIDDGERSDRVRSATQRQQWWRYLTDDVLKAGLRAGQGGTHFRVRGTVLHTDSMLAAALGNPGWRGRKFKSIIAWPTQAELWEQCRRIWVDLTLGEYRQAAAQAFYQANREEMDAGSEVLDPLAEPLFSLYELMWSDGLASFLREKQNEPRDGSSSYFNSETFRRCRVVGDVVHTADGRRVKLRDLRVGMRLDPIPGEELGALGDESGSGAGDFAAIAVLGRDALGYGYVLDVWMRRCRDTDMLNALWTLGERWGATRASIESNGFQRLVGRDFRRMQIERRDAGLWWQIAVDNDTSTLNKEDRIASLEPAVANGWLQFNEALPRPVFAQFDDFSGGAHDDAPDAVEGAWRLLDGYAPPRMAEGRIV